MVATSFLRLWIYEHNQRDVMEQWRAIIQNDLTDVTGDVFLGLGIGCAALPRSQVRPDPAGRLLPAPGVLHPACSPATTCRSPARAVRDIPELAAWEDATAEIAGERSRRSSSPYRSKPPRRRDPSSPRTLRRSTSSPSRSGRRSRNRSTTWSTATGRGRARKAEGQAATDKKRLESWPSSSLRSIDQARAAAGAFTVTDVGPNAPPTRAFPATAAGTIAPGFLTSSTPHRRRMTPARAARQLDRPAHGPGPLAHVAR